MSVQVAVRVRPFNQREKELNSECIVTMNGKMTKLRHPEDEKKNKEFTFDYSFQSHDGFDSDENGVSIPKPGSSYADQKHVYNTVGTQILKNAWDGYNCCLFAYGQTGAGKSYSMVGYKPNIGIVPIACQEIFKKIDENENDQIHYEVFCSMQEIYNEKVQDLLVPTGKRPQGGLKIRENKALGFYVDGLTKYPVESYEAIEQIMEDGSKNRTIASTQMNACSSRAHTIITIEFKQIEQTEIKKTEKMSVINLVDLAGSEKVGKTGASGDRLKEAGQINKSLTMLGMVIKSLADQAAGKKVKVPYRDSCLTKILSNALGGNSKTLMICAVSPAGDNFEETLSTLRYADQAKKIKNKAVVNESATDKLIRELTTEIDVLKKKQELFNKMMLQMNIDESDPTALEKALGGGNFREMIQVNQDISANSHLVENAQKDYNQIKKEFDAKANEIHFKAVDINKPHLTNLNEDPYLARKVQYSLTDDVTYIGKKDGDPTPQIILNAMGIKKNHASISNESGKIFIEPADPECGNYMFINGEKVYEKQELFNQDRIILGTNSTFLLIIPEGKTREGIELPTEIDWEFAQEELSTNYGIKKKGEEEEQQKQIDEEVQKKIQEVEDNLKKEKEEFEKQKKQQEEEYEAKKKELEKNVEESQKQQLEQEKLKLEREQFEELQRIENERIKKELEKEKEKKKIVEQETSKKNKIKEKNNIYHKLQKNLPRIVEINLLAKELKRKVFLQAKLSHTYYTEHENTVENKQQKKLKIQIQVQNNEEGTVYFWDLNKFANRYYMIKEQLEKYFETNEIPKLQQEEDPFWDPPEPSLICQGFLKLLSLAYLMDNPTDITLVGNSGQQGSMQVNIIPTDEKGEINLAEDLDDESDYIEDPSELKGKDLHFQVVIQSCKVPTAYKNFYVEYSIVFQEGEEQSFRTESCPEKTDNPIFNYKQLHTFKSLDDEKIEYLKHSSIQFQVYAEEETNSVKEHLSQQQGDGQLHPSDLKMEGGDYNSKGGNVSDQSFMDANTRQFMEKQQASMPYSGALDGGQHAQHSQKRGSEKGKKGNKNCNIF